MALLITQAALLAIGATPERAAQWQPHIEAACGLYGIDTPGRICAFLAQIGHESGGLRYSAEVWGPTAAQKTYEGRASLGNTQPGDGERFKGHGLIQVTGRYNHARVRDRLRARLGPEVPDFEAQPELLALPEWAAVSAADYWDDRGLNALADVGTAEAFVAITRKINGGTNGLADRQARWAKVQAAMAATPAPDVPVVDMGTAAAEARPAPDVSDFINPAAVAADTITPKETTMAPFIAAVLPALLDLVPKLGTLFASGSEVSDRNLKAAQVVVDAAKAAIGAKNEQDLLEQIQGSPEAAAAVRQAIETKWYEITEVGGGIAAARAANERYLEPGVQGFWHNPAFWVTSTLLLMPFMLLVDVLFVHPDSYSGELRVQIVTAVLTIIGVVGAYWLGTSFSSQRKTELQAGGRLPGA